MYFEVVPFDIPRTVLVLGGVVVAAVVTLTAWLVYRALKNR
jgi:hypothetical protein